MKRVLFFFFLLLAASPLAQAHPGSPIADYLPPAGNVYLAQVSSIDSGKITFAVTGVLRGKLVQSLVLSPYLGSREAYTLKSEWLLVSCVPGSNSVGWAMEGDCGWIPAKVVRQGGKVYIVDWTSHIPAGEKNFLDIAWDATPDGVRCLTLDHVKQILQHNPRKP
jgi:hypothetical protein